MNKIQSVLSYQAVDYLQSHHTSFQQVKAINAISSCRTSKLGSHTLSCECGHNKIVSNSCSNRHCPTCGGFSKELWIQKQQESLLPSHYFHLVFTVPDALRTLIYFNQKLLYNLMYNAASKTLIDLSKDKLGVTPGFSLVLHTWSQTLMFHPHLHCIFVGGGLSKDQTHFRSFKKKFFIHVKVLSAVFKGKFLEGLKQLYLSGVFPNASQTSHLSSPDAFKSFLDSLYKKDWIVFSKATFKCANHVIKYLARYTHRVAISDYRIKSISNNTVSFSYHDNQNGAKEKLMSLSYNEFMRRFLLHVLPHKFVKIRHYGFLSNRFRSSKVALCRQLIAKQRGVILISVPSLSKLQLLQKLIGNEKLCCPICGSYFIYNNEVNLN